MRKVWPKIGGYVRINLLCNVLMGDVLYWRCVVWVDDESHKSEIRLLIGDTAY